MLCGQIWKEDQGSPLAVTRVQRSAKLKQAWSGPETKWAHAKKHADSAPEAPDGQTGPDGPCLALFPSDDLGVCRAKGLRKNGVLGTERKIKACSHAFVVMEGEPYVRIGVMGAQFGMACGHPMIASQQPALFAGEVEFDENQVRAHMKTSVSKLNVGPGDHSLEQHVRDIQV